MKHLYDINKLLIIITLFLYSTFWGGIMAQIVLGAIQIIMSISIMLHFSKQTKTVKTLFKLYLATTVSVIVLFRIIGQNGDNGLELMFLFIIITMLLAIFHMYITYKINIS